MIIRRTLFALASVALLTAACGGGSEVGSGVDLSKTGGSGRAALGETTTTAAPAATAPPETAPPTTAAPTTAPPQTAPPTTEASASLRIAIVNRSQYDPSVGGVRAGSIVEWVNHDSIPRRVVAQDGAFSSPEIAPGGTWRWTANVPGEHNYSDPNVPFGVGKLVVQ